MTLSLVLVVVAIVVAVTGMQSNRQPTYNSAAIILLGIAALVSGVHVPVR